ncbi:tyrosine-type recombinase/integrase [Comamonas fluminis]|uniref:tyrosine-type recombinase/integrase n=1 Tax=Comamonas fluminis TaxID=2796366 RepID=UPI001FE61BCC|nr:site-specific integrase [Comamonas fluminis]
MTRYPKAGEGQHWTTRELLALPAAWKGDTLSDGGGLSGEVRVSMDGKVSVRFKYAYRAEGKVCWHQCGTWPTIALAEIRRTRDLARQQVSEGVNPTAAKESVKLEKQRSIAASLAQAEAEKSERLTVDDLFSVWLEQGVNRADGNKELTRNYLQYIKPHLGHLELRCLTETHLRVLLKAVVTDGTVRKAQVMLLCIKQALKWGEKRKPWRALLLEGNPADLVSEDSITPADHQDERSRILSDDEIRELSQILRHSTQSYEDAKPGGKLTLQRPVKRETQIALWIALGTICRIGELLMSRWENVNLAKGTWFIPEEDVKGQRKKRQSQLVQLSPFVLRQFQLLRERTGDSEWCFPAVNTKNATKNRGHVCIKSVSKQVGDRQVMFMDRKPLKGRCHDNTLVLSKGQKGNWTVHDLRRTGATLMQGLGIKLDTIDRCQNHVLEGSKVRRHYLHHEYSDEKAEAWLKLGEKIEAILAEAK